MSYTHNSLTVSKNYGYSFFMNKLTSRDKINAVIHYQDRNKITAVRFYQFHMPLKKIHHLFSNS